METWFPSSSQSRVPFIRSSSGTMKIPAVIKRQVVVRQILDHLGPPTGAASLRPPPDQTKGLPADQPREWPYEPFRDDPPISAPAIV
jgi:hypothetical protein